MFFKFILFNFATEQVKKYVMKKIFAIVLLIVGIFGGYKGYQVIDDSSKGIELAGFEIKAEDKDSKTMGYVYLGLGVAALVGGIVLLSRKK